MEAIRDGRLGVDSANACNLNASAGRSPVCRPRGTSLAHALARTLAGPTDGRTQARRTRPPSGGAGGTWRQPAHGDFRWRQHALQLCDCPFRDALAGHCALLDREFLRSHGGFAGHRPAGRCRCRDPSGAVFRGPRADQCRLDGVPPALPDGDAGLQPVHPRRAACPAHGDRRKGAAPRPHFAAAGRAATTADHGIPVVPPDPCRLRAADADAGLRRVLFRNPVRQGPDLQPQNDIRDPVLADFRGAAGRPSLARLARTHRAALDPGRVRRPAAGLCRQPFRA